MSSVEATIIGLSAASALASGPAEWVARVRWPFFMGLTVACGVAVAVAAWLAVAGRGPSAPKLSRALACIPLGVMAPAALVPFGAEPAAVSAATVAIVAGSVVLWVTTRGGPDRAARAMGLLMGAAATGVMLALPWSAALFPRTLLGYDPSAGMRLYGLGNETAAAAFAWALLGVALTTSGGAGRSRAPVAGIAIAAALLIAAWPGLGANLGALVWGGVGLGVYLTRRSGLRVGWAVALGSVAVATVLAALLGWLDSRSAEPTHIGVFFAALASGDVGSVAATLTGRFATSWSILTYSPLSLVPIAGIALLLRARMRPGPTMRRAFRFRPELRPALDGLLWAMPVALLVEDSGLVIPALFALFAACAVLVAASGGGEVGEG